MHIPAPKKHRLLLFLSVLIIVAISWLGWPRQFDQTHSNFNFNAMNHFVTEKTVIVSCRRDNGLIPCSGVGRVAKDIQHFEFKTTLDQDQLNFQSSIETCVASNEYPADKFPIPLFSIEVIDQKPLMSLEDDEPNKTKFYFDMMKGFWLIQSTGQKGADFPCTKFDELKLIAFLSSL